ncbi:MAG: SMC family ATPase [Clostridia bacterium]|nr:SMC family ATPase [Clostridia bacterium]
MKPIYLEFCGINSFSEKAEIDFQKLLSGGVFGIFGDTGSGKSTILDCIHLALYGEIGRSGGNEYINYKQDSAYVIFDFEITLDGKRRTFRVRRERKRKNNTAKAFLYEYTESGLSALAEGTRDVNEKLEQIIGLSFADFKTCIALPQGDFAALLKATTGDRVKLVSRLFDLEKYGERLAKAANEKYYEAEREVNLVKAKMEQNEEGNQESIDRIGTEIAKKTEEHIKANERLTEAEKRFENAKTLAAEKKSYDELTARFASLKVRLPEMEERKLAIGRVPQAEKVLREKRALDDNAKKRAEAAEHATRAEKGRQEKSNAFLEKKAFFDKQNFEGMILQVSLALDKVRSAQADLDAEKEAEKNLSKSRAEYKRLLGVCPKEEFAFLKEEKQLEIDALGEDGSLLDYLKRNFKGVLLSETYGEIRSDLAKLAEDYPQTQEDIGVLLKKYTLEDTDGVLDIAKANLAFKEIENKRKDLKKQLSDIEERERKYLDNEKEKELLSKQGKIYLETYENAKKRTAEVKTLGSEESLSTRLNELRAQKTKAQTEIENLQRQVQEYETQIGTQKGLYETYEKEESLLKTGLETALQESGFQSVDEAELLLKKAGTFAEKEECENFFKEYAIAQRDLEKTDISKFENFDLNAVSEAEKSKKEAESEKERIVKELTALESEKKRLENLLERNKQFQAELKRWQAEMDLRDELRQLLKSNKFLEYIASEYLQEICVSASKTLLSLTNGRYFLRYEKEFKVGDNLDGGSLRAVKTLSGGETFLASLSLALSLSAAICLKSLRPIEFFFLDEGFGTLDGKLVETVMDVLTKLSKNFSVGLISHVEELKHRIDCKLLVTGATESHGSKVRTESF